MLNKIKEMGWGMHFLHLSWFIIGMIPLIVFAIHRDNPKLGGDPFLLFIPAAAGIGGSILSFLFCLFSKPEGQYQSPLVSQRQEDHEFTATH